MKNQFEERLRIRIKEVFENYEDDQADRGWAELRKKYPVKRDNSVIYWFSSIAAILILVAGIWLLTDKNKTSEESNQVVLKQKKIAQPEKNQPLKQHILSKKSHHEISSASPAQAPLTSALRVSAKCKID